MSFQSNVPGASPSDNSTAGNGAGDDLNLILEERDGEEEEENADDDYAEEHAEDDDDEVHNLSISVSNWYCTILYASDIYQNRSLLLKMYR